LIASRKGWSVSRKKRVEAMVDLEVRYEHFCG
jgi:hypothetical protein